MQYERLTENEVKELEKYEDDLPDGVLEEYIYWHWFFDIGWFSDYHFTHWKQGANGFIETPDFHHEIWDLLTDEEMHDVNVIIARWHGKTTALLIYMIWRILYFPWWSIVYVASKNLWEKWLGKIRRELESNKKIMTIFGNIVPTNSDDTKDKRLNKWRQKELEFLNWSYIETVTRGQPIRGARPKEIIMDDPQDNKDVKNPRMAKEFLEWAFTSLYNVLLPWGRMVALGTIVGNLCFVKQLRDEKKWPTIEYQACNDDFENILWPAMWNKKALMERRDGKIIKDPKTGKEIRKKGIGTAYFNQEFRNIPLNTADKVIKEHWIRYYAPPLEFEYIVLAIDPATKTKEQNDFTWLAVVWVKEAKKYVMYAKWVKLPPRQLEQFIVNLNDKFEPDEIAKEDNVEVKLTDDLKARWLPIVGVWSHKDKYTRLLWVAGMIEVWDVYFLKQGQDSAIEQLTQFPDVEHDDEMDAVVIALQKAQDWIESGWSGWGVELV